MTVGRLTEPVTGPNRTDVLVLPGRPFFGPAWPPLSLPQATLVLLFSQDATAMPFDRLREITRRSAAWGAVEVATLDRVAWFRTLVRTLSHNEEAGRSPAPCG